MIASLLSELESGATATLGAAITSIATKYSVVLVTTFTVERWFQEQREVNRTSYPVLGLYWRGTPKTGLVRPSAGIRDSYHKVAVTWLHQTDDNALIERHLLYLPEALLVWLDTFPTSSTDPTKTIHQIQPPNSQGVEIEPAPINVRKSADGTTRYQWSVCAKFDVRTREQP